MTDEKKEYVVKYRKLMAQEKTVKKRKLEIKKKFKDVGRAIFTEDVKTFFETNPGLNSFRWVQYTDFFNDGEPCTFGVQRYDWQPNNFPSEYDTEEETAEWLANNPALSEDEVSNMESVIRKFMSAYTDDDLEDMFGDHVRVFVSRTGIDTETYDDHS